MWKEDWGCYVKVYLFPLIKHACYGLHGRHKEVFHHLLPNCSSTGIFTIGFLGQLEFSRIKLPFCTEIPQNQSANLFDWDTSNLKVTVSRHHESGKYISWLGRNGFEICMHGCMNDIEFCDMVDISMIR